MNKEYIIKQTQEYVRKTLGGEGSGHDWWHIYRVWKNAIFIGQREGIDLFIVQLAALLHDIADWKFHAGDDSVGPKLAKEWLEKLQIEENISSHVSQIIREISFKGEGVKSQMGTKEGMVVQDADRLDAMGAIGIARVFATGAKFNETLYDPAIPVPKYESAKEYIKAKGEKGRTVINHFYEKLLLLKDLMNTKTAKNIADKRHKFMKQFLERFFQEWEGKN